MFRSRSRSVSILSCALFLFAGCSGDGSQSKSGDAKPRTAHDHPTTGPHGGDLIEIGVKDEYHLELVHVEKAGTITFYILDGTAKKAVAIDAPDLLVSLKLDGTSEQFKVAAKPDSGDAAGRSSRFVSTEKKLVESHDRDGADTTLVVVIDKQQYQVEIKHAH